LASCIPLLYFFFFINVRSEWVAISDADIAPKIKQIAAPKKILFIGNSWLLSTHQIHTNIKSGGIRNVSAT
jgi:hypothetical protein